MADPVLTVREAVEKFAKSMKHFGFTNEANHGKTNTARRNTATATICKSPGQICVLPVEKTAK